MNYKKSLVLRFIAYFLGLFIMTTGVALSVKSNLGVSPVSSIPYTVTCVLGIEMGNATILFHVILVALQILLLRKKFKMLSLLQIAVGIIFGKFTTLCNALAALLPAPESMVVRILMVIISLVTCLIVLHGFGSVGLGTVLSAVFVEMAYGMLNRRFGKWRDSVLFGPDMPD